MIRAGSTVTIHPDALADLQWEAQGYDPAERGTVVRLEYGPSMDGPWMEFPVVRWDRGGESRHLPWDLREVQR
jgi:hypothetical protein